MRKKMEFCVRSAYDFTLMMPGLQLLVPLKKKSESSAGARLTFSLMNIPSNGKQRKEWDSNPRYGKAVRRISSPVHSITLASFLHLY